MIFQLILFFIGVIIGAILMYCYDYWRNMREFNKRQEKYKRMI